MDPQAIIPIGFLITSLLLCGVIYLADLSNHNKI